MPIKALLNNKPVLAWDVAGTGDFMCVECADKMHYRRSFKRKDGVRVTEHFAHNPTPTGGTPRTCSYVGQSEEHMNAKQAICLSAPDHFWWLNGIVGDVEVPQGTAALMCYSRAPMADESCLNRNSRRYRDHRSKIGQTIITHLAVM